VADDGTVSSQRVFGDQPLHGVGGIDVVVAQRVPYRPSLLSSIRRGDQAVGRLSNIVLCQCHCVVLLEIDVSGISPCWSRR
jgi:hypothetical protein